MGWGASSKAFFTTYIIYILKRYPLIKKGTINLLVMTRTFLTVFCSYGSGNRF